MEKILRKTARIGSGLIFLLLVGVLCLAVTGPAIAAEKVIKIGCAPDLSGPTVESSRWFSIGMRGYFDYINKKGGINGRKVEYLETDGAYDVPKEVAAYKRFVMEGALIFVAYSGGGTTQITQMATKDKIVTFSASIAEMFADVKKVPYHFIHCASYDQAWRGTIDYLLGKNPGKKLRAAIILPDNPYGYQNADMIRKHCKLRNIEIVDEEIVRFKDFDATPQMLKMKMTNPDIVLCPEVETSIVVIMRDAKKVGIDTKKVQFVVPQQGFGPVAIKLGGKDIEDLWGCTPFSDWHEKELPGIKIVREHFEGKELMPWTFTGWSCALVMSEGIRRLGDKEFTGDNLKRALETMKDFSTGDITSPITYTPEDHVGGKGIKIKKANIEKGYFESITGWIHPK